MRRFTTGMLVGLGISLLIAPRPGKELRQLLAQSWRDMRNLPATTQPQQPSTQERAEQHKQPAQEREEPIPSAQEVAQRAAQAGTTVPESAQSATQQTPAQPATQQTPAGQANRNQSGRQTSAGTPPSQRRGTPPRPPSSTP